MNRDHSWGSFGTFLRLAAIALFLAPSAHAVQFAFGSLVRAGFNSNSAPNWEVAVGATPGATADSSSLNTYWNNNQDRYFEIEYLKTTNTVNVRVYDNSLNTSPFTEVSYNPTNGNLAAATATWTLPASSFFVTATTGPTQATSIQVSNLTLSGVSGAINVIQPILQTTLAANMPVGGPGSSAAQTQDVVFLADATGSWRLTGQIQFSGIQGGGRATGSELAFNFSASANDVVPEPGTFAMGLIGLALVGISAYRTRKGTA